MATPVPDTIYRTENTIFKHKSESICQIPKNIKNPNFNLA